ncbi:MAG TPA: hypothetical protein VF032_21965 [Thermoleophilaceae bacterium]
MSQLAAVAYATSTSNQAASHGGAWVVALLIGVQIAMLVFSLWWLHREDSSGEDPGDGGGGGSGKRPPEGPPPTDEPAWWPEFEQDFATYVAGGTRVGS